MLKLLSRIKNASNRIIFRRLSFTRHSSVRGADRTLIQFTTLFRRETPELAWLLADKLMHPSREQVISETLHRCGVVQVEYDKWSDVVSSRDFDAAAFALSRALKESEALSPPLWLLIHILAHKVRSPTQADNAAGLALTYHTKLPALLIFAIVSLARYNHLNLLTQIINSFLQTELPNSPSLHFNLLLQALSHFPSSQTIAQHTVTVLNAAESRGLKLRSRTYRALLSDRFVTLELTKVLQARMVREGFIPTVEHLEAYLRVFARNGSIHDAQRYLAEIRPLKNNTGGGVQSAAETLRLSALKNARGPAFEYLAKLLEEQQSNPVHSLSKPRLYHPNPPHVTSKKFLINSKRGPDIYDWTTTFAVAARDRSTSAGSLIRLFDQSQSKTALRPTVATYTTLLRGLLHRKAYADAESVWERLLNSKLKLDARAVTAGFQLLTRAGKPEAAFDLGESVASGSGGTGGGAVKLTTLNINLFMASLRRIGRPDVVFQLWDHMEVLYGTRPDRVTLNVLLDSARLASKLDDSVRGQLALLSLRNPFRLRERESGEAAGTARERVAGRIKALAGTEYRSGVWDDRPGWERARDIFRRILFGNFPSLVHVQTPAIDPTTKLPSPVGLMDQPPNSSLPKHPQIELTDSSFFAYLQLLGTHSRHSEIPLTLAWMRALSVEPSKDTLALALVLWAEVSMRAPLIERFAGGRGEYQRLVGWVVDWLGVGGMPDEKRVGRWVREVERMREVRM